MLAWRNYLACLLRSRQHPVKLQSCNPGRQHPGKKNSGVKREKYAHSLEAAAQRALHTSGQSGALKHCRLLVILEHDTFTEEPVSSLL